MHSNSIQNSQTAKTINYTLASQYFRFNLEILIWYQWSTGNRGKVVAKRISAWLLNFFKNGDIHTTVTAQAKQMETVDDSAYFILVFFKENGVSSLIERLKGKHSSVIS